MTDLLLRFVIGGVSVSVFALLGDLLRPKSFAGLFGAAPSVALASVALTFKDHNPLYLATEGRSMLSGAIAFLIYAYIAGQLLKRSKLSVLVAAVIALPVWFGIGFGCLFLIGGPR